MIVINWILKLVFGWSVYLFFRPRIKKEKNISKRKNYSSVGVLKGRVIVASNHLSVMDFLLAQAIFPLNNLRCFVGEALYEKNSFLKFLLKTFGTIKVDRVNHDLSFLQKGLKVLEKGGKLLIYPESRLPQKGEAVPIRFFPSVIYLALRSNSPIIPLWHNGFGKSRSKVMVGNAFYVSDYLDADSYTTQDIDRVTNLLREKVIELGTLYES